MTEARNRAVEGDERIRTAVCVVANDVEYVRQFEAGWQHEAVGQWERNGLCCVCGHGLEAHGEHGCDHEVLDYGEMDCACTAYARAVLASPEART